jgi:hypothetical protein
MMELLSRLRPSDLAAVLSILGSGLLVGAVALTALIIRAVQKHREHQIASSVVLEMLDRGIAVEEIVAVLKAMGLEDPQGQRIGGRLRQLPGASASKPAT